MRWPSPAAYLAACPDAVEAIVDPLWISERFPEPLRETAASGAVRAVVTHPDGGPLTPVLVRRCCGAYDGS